MQPNKNIVIGELLEWKLLQTFKAIRTVYGPCFSNIDEIHVEFIC
jgi:hypothetical protein